MICRSCNTKIDYEYTFEEGIERVQEILRHSAKCEYSPSASNSKKQVIRILDSYNTPAMILSFTKL